MALMFRPAAVGAEAPTPSQPPASASPTAPATVDISWVIGAYALVVVAGALSWVLFSAIDPKAFAPAAGFSVFAPMYVLAQSIERFMEPFTKYLGTTTEADQKVTKDEAKQKLSVATAAWTNGEADGTQAVAWLAVWERIRRNRTVIAWAIASAAAMLLCGVFGFRLLESTGLDTHWGGLDVVLTGLAIGSGTKPLHDLISNLQKSKDAKSTPDGATT